MAGTIVVIGDRGMLGAEIVDNLSKKGYNIVGLNTSNFDVAAGRLDDYDDLHSIICTAAIHRYDEKTDPQKFLETNVLGPYSIYLSHSDVRFHYISTDYVFSPNPVGGRYGTLAQQYPTCFYGSSKAYFETIAKSEDNIAIYRCGPMFGRYPCRGKGTPNIVDRMIAAAKKNEPSTWSSGPCNITYAYDAAKCICDSVVGESKRIVHTVQWGEYSLVDVCRLVYRLFNADPSLVKSGQPYNHGGLKADSRMSRWDEAIVSYIKGVRKSNGSFDRRVGEGNATEGP